MRGTVLCPYCGRPNNAHLEPGGDEPEPGDYAVCWGCDQVSLFTDALVLRLPSPAERADLEGDDGVREALAAMALAKSGGLTPLHMLEHLRHSRKGDQG
jgi:hypothetical protein